MQRVRRDVVGKIDSHGRFRIDERPGTPRPYSLWDAETIDDAKARAQQILDRS